MPGYASASAAGKTASASLVNNGGDTYEVLYVPTAKAKVTQVLLTNVTGGTLPVSVRVVPQISTSFGADGYSVASNARVPMGETLDVAKNGIILAATEQLVLQSPVADSIHVSVTATEGVI